MKKNPSVDLSTHVVRVLFFSLVLVFIASILFGLRELVIPFSIAFLLSIFLNPAVDFFEGLGVSRIVSVTVVLGLLVGILYLAISIGVPMLVAQVDTLTGELSRLSAVLPGFIDAARQKLGFLLPEAYRSMRIDEAWLLDLIVRPLKESHLLEALPRLLTYSIITPILLFIFLLEGDEIFRNVMELVPNRFFEMTLLITHQIKSGIISYLKGLAIQITILAAIFVPGLMIAGVPYAPILGLFAATINIIPYAGPVLGATPVIVMALIGGQNLILPALLVLGIGHLIDNVFTQPVILARSVDVHPIIAVLAVITFEEWLGVAGMIVALPLAGIMVMTIQTMHRSLKSFGVI